MKRQLTHRVLLQDLGDILLTVEITRVLLSEIREQLDNRCRESRRTLWKAALENIQEKLATELKRFQLTQSIDRSELMHAKSGAPRLLFV